MASPMTTSERAPTDLSMIEVQLVDENETCSNRRYTLAWVLQLMVVYIYFLTSIEMSPQTAVAIESQSSLPCLLFTRFPFIVNVLET